VRLRQWLVDTFDPKLVELSDAAHDEAQALISGLPHVLAVQLLNQVASSSSGQVALQLAAGSFRDGTRVAFTDPERTLALISQNAGAVAPLLKQAASDLFNLAQALEQGQDASAFFHQADPLRQLRL
jgi:prephenate dehydrogenase